MRGMGDGGRVIQRGRNCVLLQAKPERIYSTEVGTSAEQGII
jgi:hypothetical protein